MSNPYPLFKNKKPFDIDVPTPNGGGRLIRSGQYVAGIYFYDTFKQTDLLQLMPKNHKYAARDLVCVCDSDNPEARKFFGMETTTPEVSQKSDTLEAVVTVEPEPVTAPEPPKPAKRGRPAKFERPEDKTYTNIEDSLTAAMKS